MVPLTWIGGCFARKNGGSTSARDFGHLDACGPDGSPWPAPCLPEPTPLASAQLRSAIGGFLTPRKGWARAQVTCGVLVRIEDEGRPTVFAIHAPAPSGAPTLVRFHGNGEDLVDEVREVRTFHDLGVGVLSVEYPGYGLARKQAPNEPALYDAAARAIGWLRGRGVEPRDTVVLGFSLGSGVAAEMAERGLAGRMILIAPYTSIPDVIAAHAPFVPAGAIIGDRFDTLSKARAIDIPVLIIRGDADEVIPPTMGDRLAASFPNATLEVVQGGQHNDLFARAPTLPARIVRFARGK